uniref:type IA DNA topoisomerase n=1 Tax=Aeromonas sp. Ne-1 TaxID=1675689 RepID=UPI001F003F7F|nr:type IA DNA topoisomerase [Aeromonas sp. Ne-1]
MIKLEGTTLILAEKPNQAQAYAEALKCSERKDGYYIIPKSSIFPNGGYLTYAFGHLVELKEPHEYNEELKKWSIEQLPIIPKQFEYKVSKGKEKQFNLIKDLIKKSSTICVGTDSDREGELIARLIIRLANGNSKEIKRLWINSLDEEAIIEGFHNLKDGKDYEYLSEEAQARQISDWLVGLNFTRLYTLLLHKKGIRDEEGKGIVFNTGRVISPTLKLIYDHQKSIENFKPKPFFELESNFETPKGNYKGKFKGRYDDRKSIQELLMKHNITGANEKGEIVSVKKESKNTKQPMLHSLSTLQVLANRKYKYSPSEVLQIVQELYDNPLKLVTYPRTDTQHITEHEFAYLKSNLYEYQKLVNVEFEPYSLEPNKRFTDSKRVQEHFAIVPTKKIPTKAVLDGLTAKQKNIYYEIVKSALAIFHAPYQYELTTIITDIKGIQFETKGKVEKSKGWKELFSNDEAVEGNKEDKESEQKLPNVNEKEIVKATLKTTEGKTTAPKPLTEGDLINLMKNCGIKDESLDEDDKEILKEVEGIGTEATRSGIIENLKKHYIEIKRNKVHVTKKGEIICQALEGTLLAKPEMTAKWESQLKKISKREMTKQIFVENTIKFTDVTTKKVKESISNLNVDSSIEAIQSSNHIALCPSCKEGHIREFEKFYGCTNYKKGCKQSFPKTYSSKKLSKTNIKQLCEKKKTSKIKGFKKKNSTDTFEAYLILDDENNLSFTFK